MEIFGLKCAYCSGNLETLQVVNGTIHTKCIDCGHTARPNPKLLKNQVYNKFRNKSVEVQYSRPTSKSGTYPKADNNVISAGLRKCK